LKPNIRAPSLVTLMKLTLQNSANGLVAVLIVAFGSLGISGGPVYPVGTNVVGTYGGILMPGCAGCTVNSDVFPPQTILVPVKFARNLFDNCT
jgi:hypothetical protein